MGLHASVYNSQTVRAMGTKLVDIMYSITNIKITTVHVSKQQQIASGLNLPRHSPMVA